MASPARGVAVFGHRGARGLAPENTLEGVRRAASLGLTGVELDIGLSADGVAVVHHDKRLNPDVARDAGGAYVAPPGPRLRDLTAAAIGGFDVGRLRAGSDYAARHPEQAPVDGARIPTLDAALGALDGLDLLVEIKTFPDAPEDTAPPAAMVEAVLAALRRADALHRAVIFAFDWRVLREAARRAPEVARCCLTEPDTVAAGGLWLDGADLDQFGGKLPRAVAATGARFWAPFQARLEEGDLREAHALGLGVLAWTVNAPADIDRMLTLGVDGIISDRPDRVRRLVEAAGRQVAPPGFTRHVTRRVAGRD